MNYLKYLPYAAIVLMFVYFTECQDQPESDVIIRRDTITIEKVDTIEIDKPYPVEVTKYIDRPTLIYVDSANNINHYSDTSYVSENYYFYYNARVSGTLHDINISFFDDRPERIVTRTVTSTITEQQYIQPRGLYIGAHVNTLGNITPSLLYMKKRWAFEAGYNIHQKAVTVGGFIKFRK